MHSKELIFNDRTNAQQILKAAKPGDQKWLSKDDNIKGFNKAV